MTTLEQATIDYTSRKDRTSHPDGTFDKAGRFYPSDSETCSCCSGLRSPSRAYPYSLMLHCRTIKHVAHLHGVSPTELRKAIR